MPFFGIVYYSADFGVFILSPHNLFIFFEFTIYYSSIINLMSFVTFFVAFLWHNRFVLTHHETLLAVELYFSLSDFCRSASLKKASFGIGNSKLHFAIESFLFFGKKC